MKKYSLDELINKANNNTRSVVISSGASKYSFSIVNNINGKRMTVSKALCADLALDKTAYFLPVEETGNLLISASPIGDNSSHCSLSGTDKKIAYNASLVQMVTAAFKLDFTQKTSMSFADIRIDNLNGNPVAIISIGEDASTIVGADVDEN